MKNLVVSLRIALFAALAAILVTPAQASLRSSIFGRSSRAMMGMSDGDTGEIYTVTPGTRSLRAALRRASGVGYGAGGDGFNVRFARNGFPSSVRGNNGSRMQLVRLPGNSGGMRGFLRSLNGARTGQPFNIFPGSGTLAERGGSTPSSFRFSGFDGTRFNRQQLIEDVPVFGPIIAGLLNRGFGSVNLLFQRCGTAFVDNGIPTDPDLISALINSAAGNAISVFDGSNLSQEISSSSFDLLQYLRSLLDLLPGSVADLIEPFLTRDLIAAFAAEASLLSDLLTQLNDPTEDPPDYFGVDPGSAGVVEFTDDRTAVLENMSSSFVYLTRRDGSSGDVTATVTFEAGSSSALLHSDVRFSTKTVTWKSGDFGPRAVPFTIINDNLNNGDVEFTLNVNVTAGDDSIGSFGSATVVIVDDDGTGGVAIARNTVLVCEYSWARNQRDLDTGTTFLNETVGYNYADFAPYLLWTGDDTASNGREVVVVDIDSAVTNGDVPSVFDIDCLADWFGPAGGFGPATLSVYFREAFSTRTSPKVVKEIEPTPLTAGGTYAHPNGSTRAITPVATVNVNFDDDAGIFTFDVTD